jgi:hypothetical protein
MMSFIAKSQKLLCLSIKMLEIVADLYFAVSLAALVVFVFILVFLFYIFGQFLKLRRIVRPKPNFIKI